MRAGIRALVLSFAAIALLPACADAATTVGSSLRQRANLYLRCGGTCTATQSARPGGAGLSIPSDGVVTRWRVRAATLGAIRLRIVRREADGTYTSLASADWVRLDRPHEPGHDVLYEFPVRLAVHAGDAIAVDRDAKAGAIFHSYGDNTTYAVAGFSPPLADDAVGVAPTSNATGRELLVNADVEKDADGDGFGDESQDNCPTIPNDQTDKPCSTPAPETTTPEGPTSTPVETTPQTRTQGSQGPPVAGERPFAKTKRRHGARRRARRSPPSAGDPQRTHGRRVRARPTPHGPSGPGSKPHSVDPRARPTPVARDEPTSGHAPAAPRPRPPARHTPAAAPHERHTARPAPRGTPERTHRHRTTGHRRPAPHPGTEPGWQHHRA